jgi:hypothetical protein
MSGFRPGISVILLGLIVGFLTPSMILFSHADSINSGVFPVDSKPYGLTYGEWSARWWQWLHSIPKGINPSTDETGEHCDQGQRGPVWFLAGTSGGSAARQCTIPADKAILISPIEVECSYAEFPNLRTESELRTCAKADQDKVTSVELIIDNVEFKSMENYRVDSPLFNFTLPPDNILGLPPQTTQGVSDGYFILLEPLPAGKHIISSKGVLGDVTTTGTINFVSGVTYHITVEG